MSWVALDLSIRSTGWAMWSRGQERPAHGTWELAPHIDYAARAYVRLHRSLMGLHRLEPIETLVFEEAIPPFMLHGQTNADTVAAAAGLAAHAMSFAEAIGCRWRPVGIAAWRRHWIGKLPRGTKTPDLKAMAMRRCRDIGWEVLKHDEAEACGLLDYQLSLDGIVRPWADQLTFAPQYAPTPKRRRAC